MTTHALAAVARLPGQGFGIEQVDISDPRPGEILVRIAGVGLCHTDLVFGAYLKIMKPPAILGHEGSGVVVRVGDGVTKVTPGDHVVLTFNSCGVCPRCLEHHPAYCFSFAKMNYSGARPDGSSPVSIGGEVASANFFGQSSFASYALGNERNVVKIDKDVPLELMGPLGCGVQTGAGAIINALACAEHSSILIIGGGAVGLSAVLGAKVQGCDTIIVVEPKQSRRSMALQLGATHIIDPLVTDLPAAVRAVLGSGVDYAFDSSGLPSMISSAIGCLAPQAKFGLVGVPPNMEDALTLPLNLMIGAGYSFIGIIEGDADPDRFIPSMIALFRAGRFPFDKMIKTYRLDQINEAIAEQAAGACIKAVMLPAEDRGA